MLILWFRSMSNLQRQGRMNFSLKIVGRFQHFIFKLQICLLLDEAGDKIFLFGTSSRPCWPFCGFSNCPYVGFSRGACKQFPSVIP